MAAQDNNQLLRSPRFQELVRQRTRFAWTLSIAMLVIYFGFILLVAFAKCHWALWRETGDLTISVT
jgi:uncharacterized membrane protein (DUF485 family)